VLVLVLGADVFNIDMLEDAVAVAVAVAVLALWRTTL